MGYEQLLPIRISKVIKYAFSPCVLHFWQRHLRWKCIFKPFGRRFQCLYDGHRSWNRKGSIVDVDLYSYIPIFLRVGTRIFVKIYSGISIYSCIRILKYLRVFEYQDILVYSKIQIYSCIEIFEISYNLSLPMFKHIHLLMEH